MCNMIKIIPLRFKLAAIGGTVGVVIAIVLNLVIKQNTFVGGVLIVLGFLSGCEAGYGIVDVK